MIKPGIPVVVGELPAAAERVVKEVCHERGAVLVHASACGQAGRLVRGERHVGTATTYRGEGKSFL